MMTSSTETRAMRAMSFPVIALPMPTTCEISYDPDWCFKDYNAFPHRASSSDSRTSFQDFIGSLYSDGSVVQVPNPSPREDFRFRRFKRPKLTRSFTSLGTYTSKSRRGSASVWESRSAGHQSRSRGDSDGTLTRESSHYGDLDSTDHNRIRWVDALSTWVPDRKPSQAFVTFVNGAPVKQRNGSSSSEGHPVRQSTSHELYRTHTKPDYAKPVRHKSAVEKREIQLQKHSSQKLHRTNTLPDLPDPVRQRSDVNQHVYAQKSEEIHIKVELPKEHSPKKWRSQSANMTDLAQKRSTVRFYPPTRQSQSSLATLPPAPPPSMTPSKSADSSRCGTAPSGENNPGGITLPATVLEKTNEEELNVTMSSAGSGPGGDESCGSDRLAPGADEDSRGLPKPQTHSRQGSSSSVITDVSALSKTSSAYFIENVSDDPVAQPLESNPREAFAPVDISPPRIAFAPSPIVLPSIPSPPSPSPQTPPKVLAPASPPPPSSKQVSGQRGTTPSPPPASLIPSPPVVLDAHHERKRLGVRWSTDSVSDRDSIGTAVLSEEKDNSGGISDMEPDTSVKEQAPLELIPRPLTPQLSTIREIDTADTRSTNRTDSPKVEKAEIPTPKSNSHSSGDFAKVSVVRKPLPKKVKKERKAKKVVEKPKTPTPPPSPSPPPSEGRVSWEPVPDVEEVSDRYHIEPISVVLPDIPLPSLHEVTAEPKVKIKNQMVLPPTPEPKKKLHRRQSSFKHTSYEEERKRQELAEKRRKKQQVLLERLKMKTYPQPSDDPEPITETIPRFEDYDFLAKYCIFDRGSHETYKEAFRSVDAENPWLSRQQVIRALRSVNAKLSEVEDEYLRRILEIMGYDISKGADFKLFSVICALSKRISALDSWMKDLIGKIDLESLEMKMDLWKALWECNVDTESNTVSLDQLCVELRAGGVSETHELDVRRKLGHLTTLDLLDFLSYIPLFVIIHESVVLNPLSDKREK